MQPNKERRKSNKKKIKAKENGNDEIIMTIGANQPGNIKQWYQSMASINENDNNNDSNREININNEMCGVIIWNRIEISMASIIVNVVSKVMTNGNINRNVMAISGNMYEY